MIVCKVCGATNEQGATFCGTCGSFLEWSGEAVQPDGSTAAARAADGRRRARPVAPGAAGAVAGDAAATDHRARPPRPRTRPRRARSSAPTAARPTTRRASTARAAPRSSRPVAPRPTRSSPRRPTSRSIPPVAILGRRRRVAVLGVLAFVFLLPKGRRHRRPRPRSPSRRPPASPATRRRSRRARRRRRGRRDRPRRAPSPTSRAARSRPAGSRSPRVKDGNADVMVWSADAGEHRPARRRQGRPVRPGLVPDGSKRRRTSTTSAPSAPTAARPTRGCGSSRTTAARPTCSTSPTTTSTATPPGRRTASTIVFSSTRDHTQNKNLDIYSRRVRGDDRREDLLVDDAADDWDPAWSPDGNTDRVRLRAQRRRAAVHDDAERQAARRRSSSATGSSTTRRSRPTGSTSRSRAGTTPAPQKQLFVANADGSDMHQVGEFDADVSDPTWSPDSTLIAVTRGDVGAMIVIVDAATGARDRRVRRSTARPHGSRLESNRDHRIGPARVIGVDPVRPAVHHRRAPPTGVSRVEGGDCETGNVRLEKGSARRVSPCRSWCPRRSGCRLRTPCPASGSRRASPTRGATG